MMMGEEVVAELKFIANKFGLSMSDIVLRGAIKEIRHMKKYGIYDTWNLDNKIKLKEKM